MCVVFLGLGEFFFPRVDRVETMTAERHSDEFKAQVVREVIEKDRTIESVAAAYDLVAQTVGNWVARYRNEHATDQDEAKMVESA